MPVTWKVLLFFVGLCCCATGQEECECVDYNVCEILVRERGCPGIQVCCATASKSTTVLPEPETVSKVTSGKQGCKCVEEYQCKNGKIKTDGEDLLNKGVQCPRNQVCCEAPDNNPSTIPPVTNTTEVSVTGKQDCRCVEEYLCTKDGNIKTDGTDLFNKGVTCPRNQVCCFSTIPTEKGTTEGSITDTFRTESTPNEEPQCECVEPSQCMEIKGTGEMRRETGDTIISDGAGFLDVRVNKCIGGKVCCRYLKSTGLQIPIVTEGTSCGQKRLPANSGTALRASGGESNLSRQQDCKCVELYQCNEKNWTIITDGENLWDKGKRCPERQVCCLIPVESNMIPSRMASTAATTSGNIILPQTPFYGEAPWTVIIYQKKDTLIFKCAGSLIWPAVVMTAAHCVENTPIDELFVRAGEYNYAITNKPLPTQTQGVRKVIPHPDFNSGNLQNNIALLFLAQPMKTNEVVGLICGPENKEGVIESDCILAGWGSSVKNGTYQPVLTKVNLPVKTRENCQEKLRKTRLGEYFILHKGFLCAGGEDIGRKTCRGDGGGPLYCPSKAVPNKMVQIGVHAARIGCGEGNPTIFASVEFYQTWVYEQLSNYGCNGQAC